MDAFTESNMMFGPFDDTSVYRIEKSKMQRKCIGVKTVEFIYLKTKYKLLFVEAKSSSPINRKGNESDYKDFLDEITKKFEDSFHLYAAGRLKRKSGYEEIPEKLMAADYQKMNFIFILVLSGCQEDWLPPLSHDLELRMKRFRTIWNSEVKVNNKKMAREQGLIQ